MKLVYFKKLIYYPFFGDIWKEYITNYYWNDAKYPTYFTSCNSIKGISKDTTSEIEKTTICARFLTYLKALYSNSTSGGELNKNCKNIYYWLFYEMKERTNNNVFIKNILEKSNNLEEKPSENDGCYNSKLYEYFDETKELVMLSIFNDNINDILAILYRNGDSNLSSCKEFIKECVYLYKSMYKKHCSKGENTEDTKISFICDIVKMFKELYCSNIYNKLPKNNNFPDLSDNTTINNMEGCPSEEIQSDNAPTVQRKESDPYIIQSVPPALGLMAGIPPLLLLIYKVNTIFIQIFKIL
ncbi:hypothetical protein PCYB_004830 [Plasmodium cynomolgi strain B]|uniref:CYIR protein n=1 Tax=Plasmodium cynomolgi (strain B) TaxID=1120755 RepID=K6V0B2_PLACD|nr:hypothetical protein PCYB_004830 [Plasmodium cynomolgi strain B]GAB69734.1 hypothetical protein PCYB_004830 [Plasmodium cynomolgi strain B]